MKIYLHYIKEILHEIRNGGIFIYPTDTIYGIGCDATNKKAVARVRLAKKRDKKPFSVIAPSKAWIRKHCKVTNSARHWIKKLPGPYTLILRIKIKGTAPNVAPNSSTIGVRIPRHWCSDIARILRKPIVTTSANVSGEPFMTSLKNLNQYVKKHTDLILYEGIKKTRPSTLVDVTGKKAVLIKR
jgi:L-threonylcarbamoyladenylate synthase